MKNTEEKQAAKLTGAIRIYEAFQLELKSAELIREIMDKLKKDDLVISEGQYDSDGYCFQLKKSFYDFLSERKNYMALELARTMQERLDQDPDGMGAVLKVRIPEELKDEQERLSQEKCINYQAEAAITLAAGEMGFDWQIRSQMQMRYEELLELIVHKNNQDIKAFGSLPVNSRELFMLYPIMAEFQDGRGAFLDVQLDLFPNGMGILSVLMELDDVDAAPVLEYRLSDYFQKICLISYLKKEERLDYYPLENASLTKALRAYLSYITDLAGCEVSSTASFNHMMVLSAGKGIRNFSQIDKETAELLYRMMAAPVDPRVEVRERTRKFIETQYWSNNDDMRCYVSPSGNCMSVVTQQREKKLLESGANANECRKWTLLSLDEAMDIPIKICLMKKLMYQTMYHKLNSLQVEPEHCRKEFLFKENYLIALQESCYGSVCELLEFMESHMPYFLKKELAQKQIQNMELLIDGKKNEAKEQMLFFASVAAFMITVLFALPMIRDTIEILRIFTGIVNVPGVSVNGVAVAIWIAMVLITGIFGWRQYRNRKYKVTKITKQQ